jgi:hypothetical protein
MYVCVCVCVTVIFALDHLRGQIVERATQCLPPVVGCVHAPAEVSDLEVTL